MNHSPYIYVYEYIHICMMNDDYFKHMINMFTGYTQGIACAVYIYKALICTFDLVHMYVIWYAQIESWYPSGS